MSISKLITSLLFFFLTISQTYAQDEIIIEDHIYVDFIRTVQLNPVDLPLSPPLMELRRGSLELSFDDIGGDNFDYTYQIIHCDKDWNRSDISELEFIDGFNGELIRMSNASENTIVDYINYRLRIPNEEIKLTISGNYLLIVFDEEELPILTKRFMVVDPKISINHEYAKCNNVELINSHQAMEIELEDQQKRVYNPKSEIFLSVLQNSRWDVALANIQPVSVVLDKYQFDRFNTFIFPGQKEFRSFDLRTLESVSRHVHSIDHNIDAKVALLETNKSRYFQNFISDRDANGAFVVANYNVVPDLIDDEWLAKRDSVLSREIHAEATNQPLTREEISRSLRQLSQQKESSSSKRQLLQFLDSGKFQAEYVEVNSFLQTMEVEDNDVYMIGSFSNWKPLKDYKLSYDEQRKGYRGKALFKQGYYDYYYATVDKNGFFETETFEGNWYETENDYLILVYQRDPTENYDQLIGAKTANSLDRYN